MFCFVFFFKNHHFQDKISVFLPQSHDSLEGTFRAQPVWAHPSAEMVSCCSLLALGHSALECYFWCSPLHFQPLAIWGLWGKAGSLPLRKVSQRDHLVVLDHITTILALSKILFLPVEGFNNLQGSRKHTKLTSVFPGQAAAESVFWWRHGCSWLEVGRD